MESWDLAEMVPERVHSHGAASPVRRRAAPAVLEMGFEDVLQLQSGELRFPDGQKRFLSRSVS